MVAVVKMGTCDRQLQRRLPNVNLMTTDAAGISSSHKEAIAFAVLGYWRWHQHPGNILAVTGARQPCLLGNIYTVSDSVNN